MATGSFSDVVHYASDQAPCGSWKTGREERTDPPRNLVYRGNEVSVKLDEENMKKGQEGQA